MKPKSIYKAIYFAVFNLISLLLISGCIGPDKEAELSKFIKKHETKVIPIEKKMKRAEMKASLSGKVKDYRKATDLKIKLTEIYSNKKNFEKLKAIKESNEVKDELLKRQLDILYNEYLFHQLDKKKMADMINIAQDLEQKFSVFRTKVDNEEMSSNDVEIVLANFTDLKMLEITWKKSKRVGKVIAADMIKLVKMRNEAARSLGFKNYFDMRLILSGQDPAELEELYESFYVLTKEPYAELKKEIDKYLAGYYKIPLKRLRPWHYQNRFFFFFPDIYNVDLNKYYKRIDQLKIVDKFYKGLGLNLEDVISHSDFLPRSGKSQVAITADIDRKGDIRILANVSDNAYSMKTLLYEAAFAAYLKNIDKKLPYTLRTPAHFFTTDAVATLFSQFAAHPYWIKEFVGVSPNDWDRLYDSSKKYLRLDKFVFSQWAQVMYHFEKGMYEYPDQNLNEFWWDLVEQYQKIKRPRNWDNPDWASKKHIITQPCSYHNYILGEIYGPFHVSVQTKNLRLGTWRFFQ